MSCMPIRIHEYTNTRRGLIAHHRPPPSLACHWGLWFRELASARDGNLSVAFGPTPSFHHGGGRDRPNPATGLRQPQGNQRLVRFGQAVRVGLTAHVHRGETAQQALSYGVPTLLRTLPTDYLPTYGVPTPPPPAPASFDPCSGPSSEGTPCHRINDPVLPI